MKSWHDCAKLRPLRKMKNLADNGNCYVITEKFTGISFSDGVTGHGFQTY